MKEASFKELQLPQDMLRNLDQLGFREMTEVQHATLPHTLAGQDIMAQAKTGSGKTLAFGLPILLALKQRNFACQAIVLCPTRELSTQVANELRKVARFQQNIKIVTLCGGQPIGPQIGSLEHGAHIVVGTPGRIFDHLRKKTLDLNQVKLVVLDEADRMLEMGFLDSVEDIIEYTPHTRQTLLFSATYPKSILELSQRFQRNAEHISIKSQHSTTTIRQLFFEHEPYNKPEYLIAAIAEENVTSAVIFCNTKASVKEVNRFLNEQNLVSCAIHGDMEQRERDQALIQFRQLSCRFLIATDVAARGLDIDKLPVVINYDLPRDADVYTHRIGRTGRAGRQGLAISLIKSSERYKLDNIETRFNIHCTPQNLALAKESSPTTAELPPMVTLCIAGGRKEKVRPGDILGALTGKAGIKGEEVGKIDILDHVAFVAIKRRSAKQALSHLNKEKIKGRKFKIRRL